MEKLATSKTNLADSSAVESSSGASQLLGPLRLPQKVGKLTADPENEEDMPVCCMLCVEQFRVQSDQDKLLKHFFINHRLVIADVHIIASLKSYVDYWRVRLRTGSLEEFCSTVIMDVLPDGTPSPGEKYFLLSAVLPEDKLLREGLQQKRLTWVLQRQHFERQDRTFTVDCLFCKQQLKGTRAEALGHLTDKHGMLLGRPDNLVFIDELLQKVRSRLEQLRCLFCGNKFPDRNTLKEHMRKKQHKAINPEDIEYDKFYIINYLEAGKSWREVERERDETQGEEESWSDWEEEESTEPLTCLFCEYQASSLQALNVHSQVQHDGFSLNDVPLTFYLQVKLVNYIRRQMHLLQCPVCSCSCTDHSALIAHMMQSHHFTLPDKKLFDQPQYFFPTFDDDPLLCQLEDKDESDEDSQPPVQV